LELGARFGLAIDAGDFLHPANPPATVLFDHCRKMTIHVSEANCSMNSASKGRANQHGNIFLLCPWRLSEFLGSAVVSTAAIGVPPMASVIQMRTSPRVRIVLLDAQPFSRALEQMAPPLGSSFSLHPLALSPSSFSL
jgi:hypothetical protein